VPCSTHAGFNDLITSHVSIQVIDFRKQICQGSSIRHMFIYTRNSVKVHSSSCREVCLDNGCSDTLVLTMHYAY